MRYLLQKKMNMQDNLAGKYLRIPLQWLEHICMTSMTTVSWWGVDSVIRVTGSRYKQSEFVQLDDIMENWKLSVSISIWMINWPEIKTQWSCPTPVPLENMGDTWKGILKERKLAILILKSGRKLFFDVMRWVFLICTIYCLGEKVLDCRIWVSCVLQSWVNQGGFCFNNLNFFLNKYRYVKFYTSG